MKKKAKCFGNVTHYSLFHSASIAKFIVDLVLLNPNISLQTNVCEKFVKSNPKRRTKEHFDLKGGLGLSKKEYTLKVIGITASDFGPW